jgi:hypothetical protein
MKNTLKDSIIPAIVLASAFIMPIQLHSAIVPVNHTSSIMKVIIDGTELHGSHVSAREYIINGRYFLSPSFVNGNFHAIVEKIEMLLQKKETLRSLLSSSRRKALLLALQEENGDSGKRTPASTAGTKGNSVLLEYVTVGNGKRMVTNIAVDSASVN